MNSFYFLLAQLIRYIYSNLCNKKDVNEFYVTINAHLM